MNTKNKLHILFLTISIFTFRSVWSQEIKVEAKLDSFVIELGDQVWLNLKVEQAKNEIILFPNIKDTIIKGIDVLEVSGIDTQTTGNKITATQRVLITAFEDSIYNIPPFAFRFGKDTLYTNSLILSVQNIQLDSTEVARIDTSQLLKVFDIKKPINTPLTFMELLRRFYGIILIVLGSLIVIALVIIFIVRKSQNKPFIKLPEKPKEPAHIIAIKALDELKLKKLWQAGKEKLYYSELTEIIRQYIENRFNIPTFERTSHELLESIKDSKILENELFKQLSQLLSTADLAKFAKYKPLPNENDLSLKNTYYIVEQTKQVEKTQISNIQDITSKVEIKKPIE